MARRAVGRARRRRPDHVGRRPPDAGAATDGRRGRPSRASAAATSSSLRDCRGRLFPCGARREAQRYAANGVRTPTDIELAPSMIARNVHDMRAERVVSDGPRCRMHRARVTSESAIRGAASLTNARSAVGRDRRRQVSHAPTVPPSGAPPDLPRVAAVPIFCGLTSGTCCAFCSTTDGCGGSHQQYKHPAKRPGHGGRPSWR
jgi:hypothetical protein